MKKLVYYISTLALCILPFTSVLTYWTKIHVLKSEKTTT